MAPDQETAKPSMRTQRAPDGAVRLSAVGPAQVVQLQRLVGNRQVAGLVNRQVADGGASISASNATVVQRDYERAGARGGIYESERFGGDGSKRERVTYVELPVHGTGTAGRGAAPPPLSQYGHGGRLDAETTGKAGYDGGHVVGLQIGGEDIVENVVPMFKAFNRGPYKTMEDTVRIKSSAIQMTGRQPWVTINCYYDEATSDVPTTFEVALESADPASGTRNAEWMNLLLQPYDIPTVEAFSEDDQKLVRGEVDADMIRGTAGGQLNASAKFFDIGTATSVGAYITATKHLPPSTNGMYPDSPALRPYEYLDILSYSGRMNPGTEMSAFRDFTGQQRALILKANMARNGGVIKSDDPADPIPGGVLSEQGTLDFPEIDHIVPKSRGGANLFSNARVVSWQLNNKDDRVKSLFGIIDMTKRELPPLTGMGAKDIPTLVENYIYRVKPTGPFTTNQVWVWGTQNFSIMSGVPTTARRLGLVKTALLKSVASGLLAQQDSMFTIARSGQ